MAVTLGTANLRFKDGKILAVPVHGTSWPHRVRHYSAKAPVGSNVVLKGAHSEAPVEVVRVGTDFDIDRASFDPDRKWQNYMEAEP